MAEGLQIGEPPEWLTVRPNGVTEVDLEGTTNVEMDRRIIISQLWQVGWRPLVPSELSDPSASKLGPFARASETSRKAALDAYPRQGSQRARVVHGLAYHGDATREELADLLSLSENSIRPRVKELIEGGWVQETEHTRETTRGSDAVLLTLTYKAREELGRQRHAEAV